MMLFRCALVAGALLVGTTAAATAETYPARPIRIVVPFGAGSGSDLAVRIMAEHLRQATSASVIVHNMPGALGLIGSNYVRGSAADGYTLLMSGVSAHSLGPFISKEVNYDPVRDFTHILRIAVYPFALVVPQQSSHTTLADMIKDAKARPGKLSWAFSSASGQMMGVTFQKQNGLEVLQVPYTATTNAMTDLMRGDLDYMSVDAASASQFASQQKIRVLAVLGEQRSAALPGIPTLPEAGGGPMPLTGWAGIAGPAGMPAEATEWLKKNLSAALSEPELKERMLKTGTEVSLDLNADAWVASQLKVWEKAAKDAGLTRQ